jgi:hypothetical protein
VQVTQADFESRIADIEPQGDPEKGLTSKDRQKLGDDYASVLMLSQQAVADHLESTPEISRELAIARMQVLSDAEFASLKSQAEPTTEEINQYYSAHLADYDQVQIRRLFIWKTREHAEGGPTLSSQAARARADKIRQAYAAGTGIKELAEDLKKSDQGMLDPEPLVFPRGELSPKMEKVTFALKEGEWSELEDNPNSLILVQLVKRRRRQLGEVSSLIEQQLQAQKLQATLDDLKKKARIWMDPKYFAAGAAPVTDGEAPISNSQPNLHKSVKAEERTNEAKTQK